MGKSVVVVGTSFMAIYGRSFSKLVEKESNIGDVEFSLGGAGRNIAEDLSLLGFDTSLITAIADDSFGSVVMDNAREQGINLLEEPIIFPGYKTGVRLAFADGSGQTYAGVNDMSICSKITPDIVERNIKALYSADCVVIESGIPQETIQYICDLGMKVFGCCASIATCKRISQVLGKLYMFSASLNEACFITEQDNPIDCVRKFVEMGLSRGAIGLGMDGALCFEKRGGKIHVYKIPNLPGRSIVDLSGCSASFLAGFVTGLLNRKSMKEALIVAQSVACITSSKLSPVSRELSYSAMESISRQFEETTTVEETVL